MKKTFMGVRLRKLRAERGMTQVALAQALGLSPSYLNQLEQNQRPLTVPVLLKISRALGVDVQQFSEDEEARLVADMRDALADNPGGEAVALPELQEIASQMPAELKRARADYCIDNSGSIDDLERDVDALWSSLQRDAEPLETAAHVS